MTCPDPEGKYVLPDGVEVPMGKGRNSPIGQSSLMYNEYPSLSLLVSSNMKYVTEMSLNAMSGTDCVKLVKL